MSYYNTTNETGEDLKHSTKKAGFLLAYCI